MTLVTAKKIGLVMALSPAPNSLAELDDIVSKGLPKQALKACVAHIFNSAEDRRQLLNKVIPEATYRRRRDCLSARESGRTERLARVFATTAHVWSSDTDAQIFLTTSHPLLRGATPLDVSMSEVGARRVEELLWKLFYGVAV